MLYKVHIFNLIKATILSFLTKFALTFCLGCDMLIMLGRLSEPPLFFAHLQAVSTPFVNFHMETP